MSIANISKFLTTHNGRDKVIRTLCYTTKLAAELVSSEPTEIKLQTISNQLSACRTILRLFDDIPMLNYTLEYGLGKEEPDTCMSILGVLTNAVDQLYFPFEHIAWASEHKLVSFRSTPWWTASTICWVLSLYLNLIKTLRCLEVLHRHKSCLASGNPEVSMAMAQLLAQQRNEILTAFRCFADLIHAVHWLPEGFLWGGKLERWQAALLGTITSIISLYQSYNRITQQS